MKRSVTRHIEEGRRLVAGTTKDLALSELYELIELEGKDAKFNTATNAFYMGVAVGARKAAAK